jgi:DNA-binding transcriptional ArsR family regulator
VSFPSCCQEVLVSCTLRFVVTYPLDRLGALGDSTRRLIFERLVTRPMAVGELAAGLPVSRPAVSQHLKVLKEAGLVTDRRNGNCRIYESNHDGLRQLRADLDRFWTSALETYKAAVEQPTQEDKQ